jgi:predicted PurR-regulated permease PerM
MTTKLTWSKPFTYLVISIILGVLLLFNYRFLTPLLVGGIFAIVTFPVKSKVEKYLRFSPSTNSNLASVLTIIILTISVFLIGKVVFGQVSKEIPVIVNGIVDFGIRLNSGQELVRTLERLGVSPAISEIASNYLNSQINQLTSRIGLDSQGQSLSPQTLRNILNWSTGATRLFANRLVDFVIFLLFWHSAMVSGKLWLKKLFQLLPFTKDEEKMICNHVHQGVGSIIYANFLSGLVHASVVFLMMLLFGVPNIFILTILTFFIGMLPLSPSEFGYIIPISIVFYSNPLIAIGLACFAEIVILWVNYILTPKVIASSQDANQVLILTSTLSGIVIFGIMGFVIGPLLLIGAQTLFDILSSRIIYSYENNSK